MQSAPFAIIEWLECPQCGFSCDVPFRPTGPATGGLELVLGQSLPTIYTVPNGEWRADVAADCPCCGIQISAVAVFDSAVLRAFGPATAT
jgi:hypothetical protein